MKTAKNTPEWSRGRTQEYNRPYWDGHMFVVTYLHARGFTLKRIGNAIGVSVESVRRMRDKATRIQNHPRWR
jgi:hypothetical protein